MTPQWLGWMLAAILLTGPFRADMQAAGKLPRIGMLVNGTPSSHKFMIDEFQEGLRELGYVEAKNISFEIKFAEGKLERLPALAKELVKADVDVIFTNATPGTIAVKQATTSIPVVFTGIGDPVAAGLVSSFANPGGNLTGLSVISPELGGKRLELLKEAIPSVRQVAVLWSPSGSTTVALKSIRATAESLHLEVQLLELRSAADFVAATDMILKKRPSAILTNPSPVLATVRTELVEFANKSRLPAMYANLQFTDAGGLMAYAHSVADSYRRAAVFVDKILKGAKPADLPVELPRKVEFIVNLKTAKQIGLTIPPNVLARADRVIK